MNPETPATVELRPGDLLTEKEASALLGLSPITLSNWRGAGKGPRYRKLGARSVRYMRADVEAFIEAGTVDPAAKAAA